MRSSKKSCTCNICKGFCRNRIGWFLPGEPEKVAEYLNISFKELFKTKLAIDWWVRNEKDIFVIAPANLLIIPGKEFSANPKGQCIFFNKESLCDIHPVKPFECREAFHLKKKESNFHKNVAKVWEPYQNQIKELLGREPKAKEFSIFNL